MSGHGATPVVFAFAGEAQFDLLAADRTALPMTAVEEHARVMLALTQSTGLLCASATRTAEVETCLVGIPVDVVERTSGRPGLAVVVGIAASSAAAPGPAMHAEALRSALLPSLLIDGQSLADWANRLAAACQNPQTVTGACAALQDAVAPVAALYTRLLNGYAPGRARPWSTPPTTEPGLQLANVAATEMYRSGDDQLGCFAALPELASVPDFTARLSFHEVRPDGVLFCAATTRTRRRR